MATNKRFQSVSKKPMDSTSSQRLPDEDNEGGADSGQLAGNGSPEKFGVASQEVSAAIGGIDGLYDDIGEKSGFITDGYLDKQGTSYGEAAKFNFLPPGMDISNQKNAEINDMPLRRIISESFPGDGWLPAPGDVEE